VGSAHYVLGPFGSDSDLRRHGQKTCRKGRQELKEAGGGGRGEEALCALAPSVGERGDLRSAPPYASVPREGGGLNIGDGPEERRGGEDNGMAAGRP
jgi:hypothetical protein